MNNKPECSSSLLKQKKKSSDNIETIENVINCKKARVMEEVKTVMKETSTIISGLCFSDTLYSKDIVDSINNLSNGICSRLDKIIYLLETDRQKADFNTDKKVNNAHNEIVTSSRNNNIGVLKELKDLKNKRNEHYYSYKMNVTKMSVYEENLNSDPIRIPIKLHEKIDHNEHENIKNIKINLSKEKVKSEIEKHRINAKVHEDKIRNIENSAKEKINSIKDKKLKTSCQNNWNNITKYGDISVNRKWERKREELNSDNHLVILGSKQNKSRLSYSQKVDSKKINFNHSKNLFCRQNNKWR